MTEAEEGPILDFLKELAKIPQIEGIAFSEAKIGLNPHFSYILEGLEVGNKRIDEVVDRVTDADARLSHKADLEVIGIICFRE